MCIDGDIIGEVIFKGYQEIAAFCAVILLGAIEGK